MLGETGTWNHTLLGAIHAHTKSPAVVILVKHANKLASVELKLIVHRRLEVKLNAVDIIGRRGCAASSDSDGERAGGSWARGSRDVFSPSWARWCVVMNDRRCRKGNGCGGSFSSSNSRSRVTKVSTRGWRVGDNGWRSRS